jgi:hypothetical protein
MDCIELHKLTVFPADAAEKQHYYMQQTIKKPQQVTVRQFVSRMGVLNDYLAYLPTDFDLLMAITGTKKMNVPFDEADLAGIMLNSVPSSWVNQCNMMHSTLPKNPRALLNNLEAIEQVMDKKHNASLKAKAKEANTASTAAKGSSKKHPVSGSSGELRVPKKARPSKFCQHCKAKGGPHLTHNTKECHRYHGNGNPVSSFQGKPVNAKKPAKKGGDQQMAYLTAAVESLVKKGLQKAMKGKKRKGSHAYDSSNNSDSEYGIGSCDTELVVDKHLKLDKPFMSDLQSTQPRPIKVTDSVSNSERTDLRALENANTGKVTAVVAVMHLYGNTTSRSISDNAKISAKKTKLEAKLKKLDLK